MTWSQVATAAVLVSALIAGWYRFSISRGTVPKLLELYLWLTPILTLGLFRGIHGLVGLRGFLAIAVIHLAIVAGALRAAYPTAAQDTDARLAGLLLVFGAVFVWLGAVSFPGGTLEGIATHREDYLSTVGGFLAGSLLSLAGFAVLRNTLRERGDAHFSQLGLLALTMATVCWILHLGFRAAVTATVAQEYGATPPAWYAPLRQWAGAMYVAYMVLAYLSIASFGAAMLKTASAGTGSGRTFVAFGLAAAIGFPTGAFAPPLMVQFMPYAMGMILLRRASVGQIKDRAVAGQIS